MKKKLDVQSTPVDKRLPRRDKVKRYDFAEKVREPKAFFQWIERVLAKLITGRHRPYCEVTKLNMEGLKPPYLILGTHMSFLDIPMLLWATDPVRVTYVCALDAIRDYSEWLTRNCGIFGKRKFIKDSHLLKNMKYSVQHLVRCALALYPEAKYSLDGCDSYLPSSLGKLAKFLDVPIVVAQLRGNYVSFPQWRQKTFLSPLRTQLKQILTREEVKTLSADELQERIIAEMKHDDFKWQKDNGIIIDAPYRADGLNRLLYQCAACGKEHEMLGEGTKLKCLACGKEWEMTELGELKALSGETEFSHIPDWFEWQKTNVQKQIADGTYSFKDKVWVRTLPNAQRFYNHGEGTLTHDADGFTLTCGVYGEPPQTLRWPPISIDGCHIEYNYKQIGDAVDLSTADESYWLFPVTKRDALTKLSLATDELYRIAGKKVKT